MPHVITFRSAGFDVVRERPNPINPIAGESVLRWLRERLGERQYQVTTPEPEDWGWYMDVSGDGASYVVGASGDAGESYGSVEWTLQIHKHRSLKEKLNRTNRLAADDPLSALIERLIRQDAGADAVEVERDS